MQDMTKGSLFRHLIAYAIPMILGNILQLTYNAVDSIIISKFLGETALAAVSTSGPIFTILVLGASGISLGASVMISKFQGAKEQDKVKKEFATTLIFGFFFSLSIFLLGFFLAGSMLRWINTPTEAMPEAKTYLQIYLIGFLFTFQYNVLSASLRGIGDSKTPVYYLSLSCGLNIVLDVLLVAVIPLGVAGAAIATVVSQAAAAIFCAIHIGKKIPALHISKAELKVDKALLKETLAIGSLTAIQQAAQPIGKVCIQSVINAQGIVAIDAFNAATKIDDYARIPTQSFGNGIMTATAQNRGAKNQERMEQSLWKGLTISLLYFPMIFLLVQLIKTPAIALLTPPGTPEILAAGVSYLTVKTYFFAIPCLTNGIQGYFRGLGKMKIVLLGTIIQTSIRTLCVFLWVPKMGINGEAYACAVGWVCQCIVEYGLLIYWKKTGKMKAE